MSFTHKFGQPQQPRQISGAELLTPTPGMPANLFIMKRKVFIWLALLLVALAILRSAIATRLDGFTMDEAYHIAAGASYLRFGDFRLNPEHPPLVKLWVGTVMAVTGFHLDPLRRLSDKLDELRFPCSVQSKSSI
jgi:hypothetical protein